MTARARRALRRPGNSPIRLTERDSWLLRALVKMRFLTTSQLARLYFGSSRWAANKRLRKLLDTGLVRVWVRNLAQDNLYSLDKAGARISLEGEDVEGGSWAVPRGLGGNLDHLLAVNQVRIALALGLPEAGGELVWWRSDWELRAQGRARVIPDALLGIRWAGVSEQVFALEVDQATRSSQGFLKKVLRYGAARFTPRGVHGISDFLALVVGRDPRWVERYRRLLHRTHVGARIWFTTLEAVGELGAVGAIWKAANGEACYSLRDLTSPPYGKEGFGPETSIFFDRSPDDHARLFPLMLDSEAEGER